MMVLGAKFVTPAVKLRFVAFVVLPELGSVVMFTTGGIQLW